MDVIINLANDIFKPILAMGGPIIMLIILTVLALLFGVKFSKALEQVIAVQRGYDDHKALEPHPYIYYNRDTEGEEDTTAQLLNPHELR